MKIENNKQCQKEYYQDNKERIGKYQCSEEFKEYQRNYKQSDKSKETTRKYRQSEKYKKYQRKYRQTNKGKLISNKACKKYHKTNSEKVKTEHKLNYLFRDGNINNSEFICAFCGEQPVEKHHENYELPFVFIPLCKNHHINYRS